MVDLAHRDADPVKGRGPVELSSTPGLVEQSAPRLGEHTDALPGEMGYGKGKQCQLRDAGVV